MNETFSTRFGQVQVQRDRKAPAGVRAIFGRFVLDVVKLDGLEIGVVMKFPNTKTDKHPWTAFLGIGESQKSLGPFWGSRHNAVLEIVNQHVDTRP